MRIRVSVGSGMVRQKFGDNQKAVESATRGRELLHQLNNLESEAQTEVVLARIAYDTGDLTHTKDRLNEALPRKGLSGLSGVS